MRRLFASLRVPKNQIGLALLLGLVFYFTYLIGRQGDARDLVLIDTRVYVAAGEQAGLWLIDREKETPFAQAPTFRTMGSAEGLAFDSGFLYVANGIDGLEIFSLADPEAPARVGSLALGGGSAHNVEVVFRSDLNRRLAFVAAGDAGLLVVDVTDPANPWRAGSVAFSGPAEDVAVQGALVFVACGSGGVNVVDATLAANPAIIGSYNPGGQVHSITLYSQTGFLAAGESGLLIVDFSNPLAPGLIAALDTPGNAQHAIVVNNQAIVADDTPNLIAIDLTNPGFPQFMLASIPGNARRLAFSGNQVFVAAGHGGVSQLDPTRPREVQIIRTYETPGEATFGQMAREFFGALISRNFAALSGKARRTALFAGIDLGLLGLGGLLVWLAFFAQFALPVRTLSQRIDAAIRLVLYVLGKHGPAIFIKDGEVIAHKGEATRRGRGVIILDTASGAMLRTNTRFTRAVGPGIVFTRFGEYIAGAVSLQRQFRRIGPQPGENPFAEPGANEDAEANRTRQENRWETSALTRDGVEVVPTVGCIFRLASNQTSDPPEGGTHFGYRAESVRGAIVHENIDPNEPSDTAKRRKAWQWLPVYLAADLWREYLRKFTLSELFALPTDYDFGGSQRTAFEIISDQVKARMTSEMVDELDEYGRPTGIQIRSREFQMLQARGLEINTIMIRDLRFPEAVENKLIEQWKANWLERARVEHKTTVQRRNYEKLMGQENGLVNYADAASRLLGNELIYNNANPDLSRSLELVVRGTLEQILRDPELHTRLTNEKTDLADLIEWIRRS